MACWRAPETMHNGEAVNLTRKQFREILEGRTTMLVPDSVERLSASMSVFYNPRMEFNRDVSVLFFNQFVKASCTSPHRARSLSVLDGLAASGIRGIRFANEVSGDFEVTVNDHNPVACRLMNRNIRLNRLTNVTACRRKLNALLSERYFDFIDIDPFGSPAPFLDAAFQSIKNNGILAITSTDVAALCGAYPTKTFRRYGAMSYRAPLGHELGLRTLIAHCIRTAAKYELAAVPVLSYYTDHYYRLYLRIEKGGGKCDRLLGDSRISSKM